MAALPMANPAGEKKQKLTSLPEDDEKVVASNVTERIRHLQDILQYMPGDPLDSEQPAAASYAHGYKALLSGVFGGAKPRGKAGAGAGSEGQDDFMNFSEFDAGPAAVGDRSRAGTLVELMEDVVAAEQRRVNGGAGAASASASTAGSAALPAEFAAAAAPRSAAAAGPGPRPVSPPASAATTAGAGRDKEKGDGKRRQQSALMLAGASVLSAGAGAGTGTGAGGKGRLPSGSSAADGHAPPPLNTSGSASAALSALDDTPTHTRSPDKGEGKGEVKDDFMLSYESGEAASLDDSQAPSRDKRDEETKQLLAALAAERERENKEQKEKREREFKVRMTNAFAHALVDGQLYLRKSTGRWKKLWCAYSGGVLSYRSDEGHKTQGHIRVSFCDAESTKEGKEDGSAAGAGAGASTAATATPTKDKGKEREGKERDKEKDMSTAASIEALEQGTLLPTGPAGGPAYTGAGPSPKRFDELYLSYLESQQASHAFKIFSTNRIYIFRADSDELRNAFVSTIRKDLQTRMNDELWRDKCAALVEIQPLLREQFIVQVNRYNALVKSLGKSGFMEDELPITSTRKEKSGVLAMETPTEVTKWRDYYFVLFEGALFYYKDSKSTTPTGFITLRFASVHLDTKRLERLEFVFRVKTPLRSVVCKTKHAVALSEWIASLENALMVSSGGARMKEKDRIAAVKQSSVRVLHEIQRLIGDVSTVNSLLNTSTGVLSFQRFLMEEAKVPQAAAELDFYVRASEYAADDVPLHDLPDRATNIFERFLREPAEGKPAVVDLPKAIRAPIELKSGGNPGPALFRDAAKAVAVKLQALYNMFKKTDAYKALNQTLSKSTASDKREVEPFDSNLIQCFVLKVKGSNRSKDIKFSKKQTVFTIGRDKSNNLVIEDSRVSRSHARVEYSDTHCEYIDLGSSCGSKLNGKAVLRAKLQPGDVVELGQSTLIFQLRKKRRFGLFGGS